MPGYSPAKSTKRVKKSTQPQTTAAPWALYH